MDVKIHASLIEEQAKQQIENISKHDAFKDAKIRIMPDVHAGKGCVCGFTADLGDKVVPNLIGVDIGCGMLAVDLGKIDIDYKKLDDVIREVVPSGMTVHESAKHQVNDDCDPRDCICVDGLGDIGYIERSVGTLGGGNHFIEVDEYSDGRKLLVVHCGSRNFGKKVCDYWQKVAVSRQVEKEISKEDIDQLVFS